MSNDIILARYICLLAMAVACAYTDMARGKLYNPVTIGGLLLGLAFAYLLDAQTPGLPHIKGALLATFAGGGLFFVIYLARGMDAGDVKLMAAVGSLCGDWRFVLLAIVYTALVGAAIAICTLIWQRRLLQGIKGSMCVFFTFRRKKNGDAPAMTIPYGVAIAVGTVWAWIEQFAL